MGRMIISAKPSSGAVSPARRTGDLWLVRGVESAKQAAQKAVELPAVSTAKRLKQSLLIGQVRLECTVDNGAAFAREAHERAPAISGIGAAFDETRIGQSVKPLGHSSRGQHRCGHQVGRIELVGGACSAQRR